MENSRPTSYLIVESRSLMFITHSFFYFLSHVLAHNFLLLFHSCFNLANVAGFEKLMLRRADLFRGKISITNYFFLLLAKHL